MQSIGVTPSRFELLTCGLGIGPEPESSEQQNVSTALFPLKNEKSDVSPCVTNFTDSQILLTRLLPGGRLLTLEEVANYLAVERTLVEKLVSEKALRVVRIGRELRVHPEDLKAFVTRCQE
jgi:excisionase family DNA binding protein